MRHIHSGDGSADRVRAAGIEGEHIPWREALVAGPAPSTRSLDEWVQTRADYLGTDQSSYSRDLSRAHQALQSGDEVVLWFDSDLFCQVNLFYLLHEAERGERDGLTLCSTRNGSEPHQAFDTRRPLSSDEISAGAAAWRAYTSDDPRQLERAMRSNSPFAGALRLHLTRYPAVRDGLGTVERTILELVGSGHRRFHALFPAFSDRTAAFGFGDAQVWDEMVRLAGVSRPLLTLGDEVLLTADGEAVLAGRADFVELNGIDLWLGGVHLLGSRSRWRWDGQQLRETV